MLKKHSILVTVVMLLFAALACVLPGTTAPTPVDPNAFNTSVAQTIIARQTEAALKNPPTATFTSTPNTPTLTLTPLVSPTSDYTATPSTPMISVSEDTNCRTGPGRLYERVGILLVGETAEIVGLEPRGEYWLIRNPDSGPEFCWVWGEYATVTGNTFTLLIHTAPPPPEANFTIAFDKLGTCSIWWADFKVTNKSDALFTSITFILRDLDTVTEARSDSNDFVHNQACGAPIKTDALVGGAVLTVSSPAFAYNPTGHNLHAKITICTEADQKGSCITREHTFKP